MNTPLLFPTKAPQIAVIRAADCIGCAKCIQACPFDAILGSHHYLHTVLTTDCTGCGLCIAPCPVDCIEMKSVTQLVCQPEQIKHRVKMRKQRLRLEMQQQSQSASLTEAPASIADQKSYIQAAVQRVKMKKQPPPGSS